MTYVTQCTLSSTSVTSLDWVQRKKKEKKKYLYRKGFFSIKWKERFKKDLNDEGEKKDLGKILIH